VDFSGVPLSFSPREIAHDVKQASSRSDLVRMYWDIKSGGKGNVELITTMGEFCEAANKS
jgi:hypothetical protein